MEAHNYDIDILQQDLRLLSNYLKCDIIRVVGGEPLTHNNIIDILKIIKESCISNKTSLITNGLLLSSTNDEIWDYVDELEVSLYPISNKAKDIVVESVNKIANRISKVRLLEYDSFRMPFSNSECCDYELVKRVYESCQIAHYWRCITLDNGHIFRCPQSMINALLTNNYNDALNIIDINSIEMLLNYLENNKPLNYCRKCLGSVGTLIEHKQSKKEDWLDHIPVSYDESIDYSYMNKIQNNYNADMKCMVRKKV